MAKEEEYKELFLSEAQESYENLNQLFIALEKDIHNRNAIDAIFRITHTLKGNAMGLGFEAIAELSHILEDIFNEIKSGRLVLQQDLFNDLFRANDVLGALIRAIQTGEVVRHKGFVTKLKVALRNAQSQRETATPETNETAIERASETAIEAEGEHDTEMEHEVVLSDMVQVPVRKLDKLLNIVGELLIEKDRLLSQAGERGYSDSELARLHRITSDLQYQVMDVRLVQVGFLFNKFHRVLRDAAAIEHKKAELLLEGTESEIDRNILKIISDSLVHLVRNSVSHGIESPEERQRLGKPETGKVWLRARNEKDTIIIEISDDGAGISAQAIKQKAIEKGYLSADFAKTISDEECMRFLFESGFSSAQRVNEISGRGVGLDAVRSLVESIGGKISIETELGKGTTFRLSLPSSMAVKGALLFSLDEQEFAIALHYTVAVLALRKSEIHKINRGLMAKYLGRTLSIVFLRDLFALKSLDELSSEQLNLYQTYDSLQGDPKLDIVIVSHNNHSIGLVVDSLTQQKEIFEKKLSNPVDSNELFSGATILGNGNVCLVLDIARIVARLFQEQQRAKMIR